MPDRSFAIIPAAGQSRRMGQPKLLMPWGESTVIEQVLASWNASQVTQVVVVIRPGDERLAAACQDLAEVVIPAVAPPEMKASVREGLTYVATQFAPTEQDVWLLAPADMPQLSNQAIDRVLQEPSQSPSEIVVPVFAGRRGHPVRFPWPLAEQVGALADDEGINALLGRHPVRRIEWGDETILSDIDTPQDYARLQNRRGPN